MDATRKLTTIEQTLLYGVGIAIMKGVSLLMLPWLTYQLTPWDMGRLEVLTSVAILGSIVMAMGLEEALYRFVGAEHEINKKNQLAARFVGIALILTILALLLAPLLAYGVSRLFMELWSTSLKVTDLLLIFSFLSLEALVAVCLGWLRVKDRAVVFFGVTVGRALLQALLVFVCVGFGLGVTGILFAGLLALLTQALILVWMQYKETGIALQWTLVKPVLVYSLPLVASGLVSFPLAGLDRWVLLGVAELDVIAQYGIAGKFALATVLLLQPFGMWWSPKRFEVLHGPDGHSRVVRYICIGIVLTLMVSTVVALVTPWMIQTLFPPHYLFAVNYALGLIGVMMLKELVELVNLGCFTGKTTRAQLGINIVGTCTGLLAMGVLMHGTELGVWSIIAALLMAQSVRLVLFAAVSQRYLPLVYPSGRLLGFTGGALLVMVLAYSVDHLGLRFLAALPAVSTLIIAAWMMNLLPRPRWVQAVSRRVRLAGGLSGWPDAST
jgi:O-antigen/teichoic acid export membrane protein